QLLKLTTPSPLTSTRSIRNDVAIFLVLLVPLVVLFLLRCNKGGYRCEDNIHFLLLTICGNSLRSHNRQQQHSTGCEHSRGTCHGSRPEWCLRIPRHPLRRSSRRQTALDAAPASREMEGTSRRNSFRQHLRPGDNTRRVRRSSERGRGLPLPE